MHLEKADKRHAGGNRERSGQILGDSEDDSLSDSARSRGQSAEEDGFSRQQDSYEGHGRSAHSKRTHSGMALDKSLRYDQSQHLNAIDDDEPDAAHGVVGGSGISHHRPLGYQGFPV